MTGIAEYFAELSSPDEFEVQAQLELFAWQAASDRRERDRWRRKAPDRAAYVSKWVTAYQKRRRLTDPVWAAKRREQQRASEQKRRAAKKALRAA